jgi:arylsulfatase
MGDWKAIRTNLMATKKRAKPDLSIELYHLADDPGEQHNVAPDNPRIVRKMEAVLRREHTPSAVFRLPILDEL